MVHPPCFLGQGFCFAFVVLCLLFLCAAAAHADGCFLVLHSMVLFV